MTDQPVICPLCGFVLDVTNPLTCELPRCRDPQCPLDQVDGRPQGLSPPPRGGAGDAE